MTAIDNSGRFLPAQVYKRWIWSIRLGLLLVPQLIDDLQFTKSKKSYAEV
ncbi:MAG: hypothetical protein H8M99_05240 [Gloeobacteraceae cyanobacterium ES-bin-144]|nr:hypothetical protein [Verrucomicrobiales bacterium]